MGGDPEVSLSRDELVRVRTYALANGLSLEEAATRLARQAINDRFVIPKRQGSVTPLGALKRVGANSDASQ